MLIVIFFFPFDFICSLFYLLCSRGVSFSQLSLSAVCLCLCEELRLCPYSVLSSVLLITLVWRRVGLWEEEENEIVRGVERKECERGIEGERVGGRGRRWGFVYSLYEEFLSTILPVSSSGGKLGRRSDGQGASGPPPAAAAG